MMPVLFKFSPGVENAWVLYVLGLLLVAYAAWSGWRGAVGPYDEKKKVFAEPTRQGRIQRAVIFGGIVGVLVRIGLLYALPASAFLGEKGEGIPIHVYGIMLAAGFMSAVMLAAELARREWGGEAGDEKREQILDLAFWVFLAAMAGSRLLFMIVNFQEMDFSRAFRNPIDCLGGGLVFQGGLIGATIAALIYTRRKQMDFFRLADLAAPTISLGACLGRLGCFSAGCCWGDIAPEGTRLALHFPGAGLAKNLFGQLSHTASLAFQSQATSSKWVQVATGEVTSHPAAGAVEISRWVAEHGHTLPVHPTQLYESMGQFALFLIFLALRARRRFHGQLFGMWLIAYAFVRGTVEYFRGDDERGTLHGLIDAIPPTAWYNVSTGQAIAVGLAAVGVALLYRQRKVAMVPAAG